MRNLQIIQEKGIKISLRTLIRWKKENGLQGRNTIKNKPNQKANNAQIANKCDLCALPTNYKETLTQQSVQETHNNTNKNDNEMKKVIKEKTITNDYVMIQFLSFDPNVSEYYVRRLTEEQAKRLNNIS